MPFNFQYVNFKHAFMVFQDIFQNPVAIHSNANLLANVFIGIPGSFFFLSVASASIKKNNTSLLVFASIMYCAALAFVAEFLQIYFIGRMTLLSDIFAQVSGGFVGVLLWFFIGKDIKNILDGFFNSEIDKIKNIKFLFSTYIFLVVFFQLLPLDLTARLGAIYDQFQNGKIILTPFSSGYSLSDFLSNLPVGIAWIPVGWVLIIIYRWSFFSVILFTLIVSFLIELLQIFIYSRITDINDVIISILCCSLGSIIAFSCFNKGYLFFSQRFIFIQISFIVWIFVIINKFWFPFNFITDYFYIVSRIKSVNLIPLKLYVEKPYLHSLFNMVEIVLYFIPLGIIFFLFVRAKMTKDNYKVIFFVFTIGICFFASLVEFGQIFIPSRYPDVTDWLLMIVGGFIGFLFFQLISSLNSSAINIRSDR